VEKMKERKNRNTKILTLKQQMFETKRTNEKNKTGTAIHSAIICPIETHLHL